MSIRALATEDMKLANNLLSANNHALLSGGDRYYNQLEEINIPTLVIITSHQSGDLGLIHF